LRFEKDVESPKISHFFNRSGSGTKNGNSEALARSFGSLSKDGSYRGGYGLLFGAHNDSEESLKGRISKHLAHLKLLLREPLKICGNGHLKAWVLRNSSLKEDVALLLSSARAASDLSKKLKRSLRGSEVGDV
jgi:hypothetical protein